MMPESYYCIKPLLNSLQRQNAHFLFFSNMVPRVRLELTRISPLASKTSVATITPPRQKFLNCYRTYFVCLYSLCCLTQFQQYSNLDINGQPSIIVVFLQQCLIIFLYILARIAILLTLLQN